MNLIEIMSKIRLYYLIIVINSIYNYNINYYIINKQTGSDVYTKSEMKVEIMKLDLIFNEIHLLLHNILINKGFLTYYCGKSYNMVDINQI